MNGYVRSERVMLRAHPQLSEAWVQSVIAQDPAILGLGDLVLRDRERIQPRAGRLDLLLQDTETKRRYEVELQLGATDESHIVRTIECWDIERKRYPQYDHCAVIIAEDITSRFLNIISLFNGSIPLIAIQMHGLKVGNHLTLNFVTVVNELTRGLIDEDEDAAAAPADRAYWEAKANPKTVAMVDDLIGLARQIDPALQPKYNVFYIGMTRQGQTCNFAMFRPRKGHLLINLRLPEDPDITARLEQAAIDTGVYDRHNGAYRLRLSNDDISTRRDTLVELLRLAYEQQIS
jgi:hypothetical protein